MFCPTLVLYNVDAYNNTLILSSIVSITCEMTEWLEARKSIIYLWISEYWLAQAVRLITQSGFNFNSTKKFAAKL